MSLGSVLFTCKKSRRLEDLVEEGGGVVGDGDDDGDDGENGDEDKDMSSVSHMTFFDVAVPRNGC